ncbi:ITA7 protein, partial [Rhabdornis inornatus]|nr:ITA7 protein [Rhabdornis inornatus]
TGGLFACPLSPELSDCWRVPIDEGVDPQRESKENQWLGVSVKSQGPGGKIVVSAGAWRGDTGDILKGGVPARCDPPPVPPQTCAHRYKGLAAAFSPDRRYVLLGAPGTYNWKGLLFVTNIESAAPDQRVFRTPEPGERVPGAAADVAHNSYLGFSVDSGAGLTRPQQLSFVTGAPRANHTGAVVILRRDSANRLVA